MDVLVVGASGHVGWRLVDRLVDGGFPVRGLVRQPRHAPRQTGVEPMVADLQSQEAARAAVKGMDAVYITPPEQGPDALALERQVVANVLEAAARADMGHVVLHTALHAQRRGTGVRLLDNKRRIEAMVRDSGVPHTVLRPGLFLDVLLRVGPHGRRDRLRLPWPGDRHFAATAARDVAEAAFHAFQEGPMDGACEVARDVSGHTIAQVVGQTLARDIHVVQEDPGRLAGAMPLPPGQRALYAELLAYVRDSGYLRDPGARGPPGPPAPSLRSFVHEELAPRLGEYVVPRGR